MKWLTVNSCYSCTYLVWFRVIALSLQLRTMLFISKHLIGNWGIPDTRYSTCVTLFQSLLQVTLYSYNWSVDLGTSLNRELVRLVQWQNARAHVVHCLLNQKMGLFHHYCFSDAPIHEMDSKQVKALPVLTNSGGIVGFSKSTEMVNGFIHLLLQPCTYIVAFYV